MKIIYRPATNCPSGQFVVYAENETDRQILRDFFSADLKDWKWHLHGHTVDIEGIHTFNFGWAKRPKKKWWQKLLSRVT